jgi:hypothetical protein
MNILAVNLILSTLVFCMAARLYPVPRLPSLAPRAALTPMLLLHSLRHLGLMFRSPGAVYPAMPPQFTEPAAAGGLLAAMLALAALAAVARGARWARSLV